MAKGATVNYTGPTGRHTWIDRISFQYVADATVATRIATIYIDDGTPELTLAKFDIVASQTLKWGGPTSTPAYASYLVAHTQWQGAFGGLYIPPGGVFAIGISAPAAGDTWTASLYLIEQAFTKA